MGSKNINKQNQQDDFLCIHIAVWSQLYYRLQCTYIKPRMAAHTLQKDYVEAINAQTDFMADLDIPSLKPGDVHAIKNNCRVLS